MHMQPIDWVIELGGFVIKTAKTDCNYHLSYESEKGLICVRFVCVCVCVSHSGSIDYFLAVDTKGLNFRSLECIDQ